MCVTTIDKQSQLLMCAGAFADGSIRVMTSGVGFYEQASLSLNFIKSIFNLRKGDYDAYIVLSFVTESRILSVSDDGINLIIILKINSGCEIEEFENSNFETNAQTVLSKNFSDGFIQVFHFSNAIIYCRSLQILYLFFLSILN